MICALQLAERHEIEPRVQLVPREQPRQLARLVLRCARQERIAVKVDERRAAAASHHPPRRDRRVDAARQQRGDAARRADGQPARAAAACRSSKRAGRHDLDANDERRVREIDLPAARLLDAPADHALELGRRNRKLLVGAADTRRESSRRGRSADARSTASIERVDDRAARGAPARNWRARTCASAARAPRASRLRRAARSRRGPSACALPARRDRRAAPADCAADDGGTTAGSCP